MTRAGCCGTAGSFGDLAGDHYRISIDAGERVLLLAVRAAVETTLVVADGFSCRTQMGRYRSRRDSQRASPADGLA